MKSMKQMILTIVNMIEAHKQALEVEKAKKAVLISGDVDGLKGLLQQESELVAQIQQLEQQRIQYVAAYLNEHGVKGEYFTLDEVLAIESSPKITTSIQALAKELRGLIEQISTLNQTNQQLIESSLSYIQYSVGMLVPNEPSIGYGPNRGKRYASLLDAKI